VVQAATNVEPVLDPDCGVLGAVAAGQSRARRPPVQVGLVAFDRQLVFQSALYAAALFLFKKCQ
jgi:hypothetical protein